MESIQQGTPPPFAERQVPSTPIIFRTKNTEKSQPVLGEKISEKICGKMFRGKRKPPILAEIEGEVLIITKDVLIYSDAKVVELF